MPSPEEIERRRIRNAARAQQKAEAAQQPTGGLGLFRRAVQPALEFLSPYWEYPRRLGAEVPQRFGETRETVRERGVLGGAAQLGRETLSDILDVAATATVVPEEWGEAVDPSRETEMGAEVERIKQQFRDREGRNPTMPEEYDIMATVQDREMPWLTERVNIGPLSFSNRMLIEGPVEAGAAIAETAATGGIAGAGILAGKGMTKASGKLLAQYGVREGLPGATARATAAGVEKVGQVTRKALLVPRQLDNLAGAMVSKPLGLMIRGTARSTLFGIGGARATKTQFKNLINIFRKKALDMGYPRDAVDAKVRELTGAATAQGKVDEPVTFADLYIAEIDRDLAKVVLEAAPEVAPTAPPNMFNLGSVPVGQGSTWTEQGRDVVRGLWDDYIVPMENNVRSLIPKQFRDKYKDKPIIGGLLRDPVRIVTRAETPEGKVLQKQSFEGEREVTKYSNAADETIENVANNARHQAAFLIGTLVEKGILRYNVGPASIKTAAQSADASPNLIVESGQLVSDILDGKGQGLHGNYVFNDDALVGTDMSFKGDTLVSDGYKGVRSKNARGEIVDANLMPGFADVAERLPLYRQQLISIKMVVGNETLTAYDVIERITRYSAEAEDTLVALGVNLRGTVKGRAKGAVQQGVARGVLYDEGAHYYPRNPLGTVEVDKAGVPQLVLPEKGMSSEITFDMTGGGRWGVPSVKGRVYLSQAEGMTRGQWYANPADALDDYIRFAGEKVRNNEIGEFIKRFANMNKMEWGTAKDLLQASDAYKRFAGNLDQVRKLINNNNNRQRRTGVRADALLNASNNIMTDLRTELRLTPLTKFQGNAEGLQAYFDYMDKKFAKWRKDVLALKGRRTKNTEELDNILKKGGLLDRAQAHHAQARDDVLRGKGQLGGMQLGLEGVYFPEIFRNAIMNAAEVSRQRGVPPGGLFAVINANLRMLGATGDMSAIGIQGSAALFNDLGRLTRVTRLTPGGATEMKINRQSDSWIAFTNSLKAWTSDGPDIVGEYFYMAERSAISNGLLTPDEWATAGLGILANAPDLYVSGRLAKHLGALSRFDRMFTQYGNVLRHGIADAELQVLMATTGKTARELLASGEAAQIAGFANVFTGVGQRKWGGNTMQFLLFAPRFFHARMKVASDALMGVLPYTNKTLQRRIASKQMARYMGFAASLTFMINEATGNETDINPWIRDGSTGKWHFNPNFMRVHAGPLDISFFGPYDSLFRIASTPVLVAFNIKGGRGDEILRDLRGLVSAPVTSLGLDIVTGYNAIGEKTRPEDEDLLSSVFSPDMLETVAEHLLPFAWNELVYADPGKQNLRDRFSEGVSEAKAGQVVAAAAQATLGFIGAKSTYETVSETLNKAYADIMALGPDDPRIREAFGVGDGRMTDSQLRELWAGEGRRWWNNFITSDSDFDLGLSFRGIVSDRTPTWEDVAGDVRKSIQKAIRGGRFQEIMTAEELTTIENRVLERMESSAADYSQYSLMRDERIDKGLVSLQNYEAESLAPGGLLANGQISEFIGKQKDIRKNTALELRTLTSPGGAFPNLTEELFEFSRDTALGNLSTFDKDIFDSAQAWYYTLLYPAEDAKGPDGKPILGPDGKPITNIVNTESGHVDWDAREQRLEMWEEVMKERFPSLNEARIKSYRLRLEEHQKKDAPPITGLLLDMQDEIGGSGYYDIRKGILERYFGDDPARRKIFEQWEDAHYTTKASLENRHSWLEGITNRYSSERLKFFAANRHIEPMLMVVASRTMRPRYPESIKIHRLLELVRQGHRKIDDMQGFLVAVMNIRTSPEDIETIYEALNR